MNEQLEERIGIPSAEFGLLNCEVFSSSDAHSALFCSGRPVPKVPSEPFSSPHDDSDFSK